MTAGFSVPTAGSIQNTSAITFPTASAEWGTIRYVGIMDAPTEGNLLYWGQLTTDKNVGNGDTFSIAGDDLVVSLGGNFAQFLANKLLAMSLNGTAFSTPGANVYAALYTTTPNAADAGGTELSGNGYGRVQISGTSDWDVPSGIGSTANTGVKTFPAATASGELLSGWPLEALQLVGMLSLLDP